MTNQWFSEIENLNGLNFKNYLDLMRPSDLRPRVTDLNAVFLGLGNYRVLLMLQTYVL